jgi:hypothetical protein
MVTPMVRMFVGSTLAIKPMVAGKEIADQARKNIAPIKTACHAFARSHWDHHKQQPHCTFRQS